MTAAHHARRPHNPFAGYRPDAGRFQLMDLGQLRTQLRVLSDQAGSTGVDNADERRAVAAEIARRSR